jgi:hypothetical protein
MAVVHPTEPVPMGFVNGKCRATPAIMLATMLTCGHI